MVTKTKEITLSDFPALCEALHFTQWGFNTLEQIGREETGMNFSFHFPPPRLDVHLRKLFFKDDGNNILVLGDVERIRYAELVEHTGIYDVKVICTKSGSDEKLIYKFLTITKETENHV